MKNEKIVITTLIGLFALSVILSVFFQAYRRGDALHRPFRTETLASRNGIAILHITGPLSFSVGGGFIQPNSVEEIIEQIYEIKQDKNIRAVILRINSPGGTVGSAQEIYHELQSLKEERKIPIIASIADMGASGGYWIALASDTIMANPGSMVGNIGVIMGNYDLSNLQEKFGIGYTTIKSARYKDLLSSWRDMSDPEKEILQNLVNDIHQQFVLTLRHSRNLTQEKALELADGRIYSGNQALQLGLIDELGGFQDAIDFAKEKAGIKGSPELIMKSRQHLYQRFFDIWRSESRSDLLDVLQSSHILR